MTRRIVTFREQVEALNVRVVVSSMCLERIAYGDELIARGFSLDMSEHSNELSLAVAAHQVSASMLAAATQAQFGSTGEWWGIMSSFGDLVDFKEYAENGFDPEYSVIGALGDGTIEDYGKVIATMPVVLVGKRPTVSDRPWDPDLDSADMGMMGNSYLPHGQMVELTEIHYDAGDGWRSIPASGIQVRTSS